MPGRNVHLFAAAIFLTIAGTSAASADGCSPCGSNLPNIIYGTPAIGYYQQPLYRVNQGPVYQPPLLPYGTPPVDQSGGYDQGQYPYVGPYSGYGYPFYYPGNRLGGPGYRHHHFAPGPRFRTGMNPHRFADRRPMMRGPMVRRGPGRGRHW